MDRENHIKPRRHMIEFFFDLRKMDFHFLHFETAVDVRYPLVAAQFAGRRLKVEMELLDESSCCGLSNG